MNWSKTQFSLLPGMLKDIRQVPSPAHEIQAKINFRRSARTMFCQYIIIMTQIQRCNMKSFQRIRKSSGRQVTEERMERAECAADFSCMLNILDNVK